MTFELRKLNATDLFPMVNIISKIGLDNLADVLDSDTIKNVVDKAKDSDADVEWMTGFNVALKLANKILENLPKCEKEIYTLLSNVSGMTQKEIKELDLDVFLEMIIAFIMKDEFKSFFKVASKYIG